MPDAAAYISSGILICPFFQPVLTRVVMVQSAVNVTEIILSLEHECESTLNHQ